MNGISLDKIGDIVVVLIDANIANHIESLLLPEREALLTAIKSSNIQFQTSVECIEEIMAVAGTQKADRLPGRARLLLTVTRVAPFRRYGDVVLTELRGAPQPLVDAEEHEALRAALKKLAGGAQTSSVLKSLTKKILREKAEAVAGYRRLQGQFRRKAHGQPSLTKSLSFDDYHRAYWQKQSSHIDKAWELDKAGTLFADALKRSGEFAFTCAFARVHTALLYRHLAEDRKVDSGDVRDGAMLVHLAGADTLVTEDRGLHELAAHVWGSERDLQRFEEFRRSLV